MIKQINILIVVLFVLIAGTLAVKKLLPRFRNQCLGQGGQCVLQCVAPSTTVNLKGCPSDKICCITKESEKPFPPLPPLSSEDNPFGVNGGNWFDTAQAVPYYEDIGVKHLRYWFAWANIEPEKGGFTWRQMNQDIDHEIKALLDANINILGILGALAQCGECQPNLKGNIGNGTPLWARREDCQNNIRGCPPADFNDYANFVRAVVHRYKPGGTLDLQDGENDNKGIRHWEILNEPDEENEWNAMPEEYVDLLCLAYQTIKEEDPEAKVLNGGSLNVDPGIFRTYYQAGAKDCFDILAFHGYRNHTTLPNVIKGIREVMQEYGDKAKAIWNTEGAGWGANQAQPDASQQKYPEQSPARYLLRFFVPQLAQKVEKIFWFATEDWVGTGLFKVGKERQPVLTLVYYSYKLMTDKLGGSNWNNVQLIVANKANHIYVYKFVKDGQPIYVAWWDYLYSLGEEALNDYLVDNGFNVSQINQIAEVGNSMIQAGHNLNEIPAMAQSALKKLGFSNSELQIIGRGVQNVYVPAYQEGLRAGTNKTTAFTLPVDFTGTALITNSVPSAEKGADLNPDSYPDFFETQTVPVNNGQISFALGADPIFIEQGHQ